MKKLLTWALALLLLFSCTVIPAGADSAVLPVGSPDAAEPDSAAAEELPAAIDGGELDAAAFAMAPEAVSGDLEIEAPSAILMEKETGTVLFEKDADTQYEPASVTKVMTILLIAEALEDGTISLEDPVSVSEYAAGMGGSQIYLEPGEIMTVHELLKSIVVASANDAAVAMAEYIAGSEQAFVAKMNERAAQLGMENTNFCNCTGLLDQPEHVTTARDIAVMSRELLRHEFIKEYTTIWMDSIRGGEFGLSNTNKLIYYYDGATGLKTGFTSEAGYCLSASALRDGVEYIAVVMHCETSQQRFESAKALLSYGFATCTLADAGPDEPLAPVPVRLGSLPFVQPELAGADKLLVEKALAGQLEKTVRLEEELSAPVAAGQQIGIYTVTAAGKVLLETPILAQTAVSRLSWPALFGRVLKAMLTG